MKKQDNAKLQRAKDFTVLARAVYDAISHEDDHVWLKRLRGTVVEFNILASDIIDEDNTLHPDIGLTLLLFLELKTDGEPEAEADRKDALAQIEEMERDYLD
jgi:hypothetical protein